MDIRLARADEFSRVAAFYRENGYTQDLAHEDIYVIAESGESLCATLRLSREQGFLILRGMRVIEARRRRGLGTRLLLAARRPIGDEPCYCIPHRHLRSFYEQIGFREVEAQQAPGFLAERCERYRRDYGRDVILMHRAAVAME